MTPTCPECIDGKGLVTLFSSVRPCRTCAARRAEEAKSTAATVTVTAPAAHTVIDWAQMFRQPLVNGGKWPP